jgi:hypothetical protein
MSAKKGRSLADVMGDLGEDVAEPLPAAAPAVAADRPQIVPVSVLVTPADRKRLRQLSLDTGLSLQRLGHEALNMMLEARGLEPLQAVSANVPSGRSKRG